jgi:hypothetical protein
MEALRFLAAQDNRMRRKDFTVDDFVATYPLLAAGVFSDRMNVSVRVEDDEGEVYDPRVDEDSKQLVVSRATPVSGRSCQSLMLAAYQLLLLRDRPQSNSSSSAAADDEGHSATVTEAAERVIAIDALGAAMATLQPAGYSSATKRETNPAEGLAPWDREDADLVAAVDSAVRRARSFLAPISVVLPGLAAAVPNAASLSVRGDDSTLTRPRRAFLSVFGGLEALRWRVVRAALDGELHDVLVDTMKSVSRRLTRRGLAEREFEPPLTANLGVAAEPQCITLRDDKTAAKPAVGKPAAKAVASFNEVVAGSGSENRLVVDALEATWGSGREAGQDFPMWWRVLLQWECVALEAEFLAAGL